MKIAFLSSFYPLRGGIAQFNAAMYGELGKTHTVRAWNFKRQYPGILFPGKTQYVTPEDDAAPIESDRTLDTICPGSWCRTARRIAAWEPDILVMKYWMSWFAPSLGYVARRLRRKGCTVITVLDNVIPHEQRFFDKPLTRYFLRGNDGFIALSDSVRDDLLALRPDAPNILMPHPLYDHFGKKTDRAEAHARLGLDPEKKTLLFFGLIRDYKGLDILIDAFGQLPEDYQLVVAGEPYGSFDKYQKQMDAQPGKDRIKAFPRYIDDAEVKDFFGAADLVVLPYRSATQSGISSIACHFEVPMVVTDVGGLKSTLGDTGTSIVVNHPDSGEIRDAIGTYFADAHLRESLVEAMRQEKRRLSWSTFCRALTDFAGEIKTDKTKK